MEAHQRERGHTIGIRWESEAAHINAHLMIIAPSSGRATRAECLRDIHLTNRTYVGKTPRKMSLDRSPGRQHGPIAELSRTSVPRMDSPGSST